MATDQEIRDAGFKYVPQQKYLLNPFKLPEDQEPVTNEGIVNTNAFVGGSSGDGFNVYNPDPNSIVNKIYRPNYDYRKFVDYNPELSDLQNQKIMQGMANFKGYDYYNKPPSKMEGLMSMIPYAGSLMRGTKFLGDQISPYLPVNRRAILENELGGQGIMVNDIGQIVQGQGDYNTAENIMAGYNANKITQETINKRKATINESLGKFDKYDKSSPKFDQDKYNQMQDKLAALDEFGNTLDSTNTTVDKIYDFEEDEKKKNKKNTVINRFITKKKEKKAAKDIVDVEAVKANIKKAEDAAYYTPDGTPGGGAGQGIDISNAGNIRSSDNNFQGDSGPTTQQESDYGYGSDFGFAKGGRAGYFFGGRARLQGGGGADMGAPEKAAERTSRGYGTAPDTGSKSGTNDYSSFEQNVNHQRAMRENQNPVPKESILNRTMDLGSELSYLNNLKNLNVLGIVGNIGVNKFRNYLDNRKTTEENDKFSYNTNNLPTNNYFAEVQQKDLDASKMKGFKKQDYPSYKDQMDMLNGGTKVTPYEFKGLQDGTITTTGTFTAANGGRAMFKNGGLASIL